MGRGRTLTQDEKFEVVQNCIDDLGWNNFCYKEVRKKYPKAFYIITNKLGGFKKFFNDTINGVYQNIIDISKSTKGSEVIELKENNNSNELSQIILEANKLCDNMDETQKHANKLIDKMNKLDKEISGLTSVIKEELKKPLSNKNIDNKIEHQNTISDETSKKIELLNNTYNKSIRHDIVTMIKRYAYVVYGSSEYDYAIMLSHRHMIYLLNKKLNIDIDKMQIAYAKLYKKNVENRTHSYKNENECVISKIELIDRLGLLVDYYYIVKDELDKVTLRPDVFCDIID